MIVGSAKATSQISAPSSEPLTTAELKLHLRVDHSDEDTYIDALGTAARRFCERATRRKFVTQTWDLMYDRFPSGGVFVLPDFSPLQSVSSITYTDTDGNTGQTVSSSDYTVDTSIEPPRIHEAYGASWPATRDIPNAVSVRVVAGYGDPEDVPETIKAAIKLLVGHWYENREGVTVEGTPREVPVAVSSLLGIELVPEVA